MIWSGSEMKNEFIFINILNDVIRMSECVNIVFLSGEKCFK